MTTYRLPAELGSAEVDTAAAYVTKPNGVSYNAGLLEVMGGVLLDVPGVGIISVPRDKLTEVKPPLPPQPDYGEFVACGTDGNLLPIYRRWHEGWANVDSKNDDGSDWGALCAYSMERAGRYPVRLIADPANDAPELPWTLKDSSVGVLMEITRSGSGAHIEMPNPARFDAKELEQIAAVLWRAAREVEQR